MPVRKLSYAICVLWWAGLAVGPRAFAGPPQADVVLIVDTSKSMKQQGYDRERSAVLVSKLFADVLPGKLAVVRLLDFTQDAALLPSKATKTQVPCTEDPTETCTLIEPSPDWEDQTRAQRHGAISRPLQGDVAFKRQLASHLEPKSSNSPFYLAFRSAQGVFDSHGKSENRHIIWLSDGRAGSAELLQRVVGEVLADGINVHAIVFGKGDTKDVLSAGLTPRTTSSPGELMHAYADALRQIIGAPFAQDGDVASDPTFEIRRHVSDIWVVVWSTDPALSDVRVRESSGREIRADYARDVVQTAGAYRVAHWQSPEPGTGRVIIDGGAGSAAYAVVQYLDVAPELLSPASVTSGVATTLEVGLMAGGVLTVGGDEILEGVSITLEADGQTIVLRDDGVAPDNVGGDGKFSGTHTFRELGTASVTMSATSELVDRQSSATVEVTGRFDYSGDPVVVDLGALGVGATSCRPLEFSAVHEGELPFSWTQVRSPPSEHGLRVLAAGTEMTRGEARATAPGTAFTICLDTGETSPSSRSDGAHWITLAVGDGGPHGSVPVHLVWVVDGLPWWLRWLKVLLAILALLVALFVAYGFIYPRRFPRGLAITFGEQRADLEDDVTPTPVKTWRGVGIGFYRHARAFIRADYRLSGKSSGAVAELRMTSDNRMEIHPLGTDLQCQGFDGEWETITAPGRFRPGEVYRSGDSLWFRVAVRRGG